ncbi:MAG: peptide chain release factor N(5)-glutamine methyltransferase [Planctomycetia bacterium]|nr:peptide chain release factor N(5)-glutamine methyltransferase [Planctomycetia bacterium]
MSQSDVWTIQRLLEWTTDYLTKQGSESARLEAEVLLSHSLNCKRIELYTNFETIPDDSKRSIFRNLVKRRATGEPVAYLTGHKEFFSLDFDVSPDVLIPRSETEQVVLEALDCLKQKQQDRVSVCDIGTGSGNIAIALAKNHQTVAITAVDLSPEALVIATKNAARNQVSDRITFVCSDLFLKLTPDSQFDIIVSNPPYVSDAEYEKLEKTVREFEPKSALLAGPDGTELIERLSNESLPFLKTEGEIFIEISPMIAEQSRKIFESSGTWKNVRLLRDFAAKQRILSAVKND